MAPWGAEALPQKPGRSLLEYQMKNINTEKQNNMNLKKVREKNPEKSRGWFWGVGGWLEVNM